MENTLKYVKGLTLTEVRYWFYHQPDDKQTELLNENGLTENDKLTDSVFENIRDKHAGEILNWYDK